MRVPLNLVKSKTGILNFVERGISAGWIGKAGKNRVGKIDSKNEK
jgi:hypothetical protein